MPTADPQQLRALVGAVHRDGDRYVPIAVRAEPVWAGPDVLDGPTPIRVIACPSPLAVRAALTDHPAEHGVLLALLTTCSDGELGPDVLARLAKRRVLSLDPFSAVLALFGATLLDPTLVRDERWLIDDLIELAPGGGWPTERPTSGVLDAERAWRVWHNERFRGERPESLVDVLRIAEDPSITAVVNGVGNDRRVRLAGYWAGGAAPVDVMLDVIAAGNGSDLTALGLVAEVLWAVTDDPALAQAQTIGRARLEPKLGRDRLVAASVRAWLAASAEVVDAPDASLGHLDRAEAVLASEQVLELALLSDRLPRGFDLRLQMLADALTRRDLDAATTALAGVKTHRRAQRETRRVATAEAAVRLLRRSTTPVAPVTPGSPAGPDGFADAVVRYTHDGAWVDEARRALTDGDGTLADVYEQLLATVAAERRSEDLTFARALAAWTASEPVAHPDLVPLEHVLDTVVAPIAVDAPVLMLVCDGMGLPVAHELLRDLEVEGWTSAAPEGRTGWPTGVALLPTVTEVSRTSLLTGTRTTGAQPQEQAGFTKHPALTSASRSTKPPVLFHKAALASTSGRALPERVRAALADPDQRVVGVVVNAVDDHLSRGDQVRVGWGLDSLRPLAWLLEAAQEAGRVVVLTADHGHVLHAHDAESRATSNDAESGERWRTAPPVPAADEIEVAGPRVLPTGPIVLPADERIRYAGYKHGYHGGATPQEVLVPVAVLARTLPAGWTHRRVKPPVWWTGEPEPVADTVVAGPPTRPAVNRPAPQPTLFEPTPVPGSVATPSSSGVSTAGWVVRLMTSPTYQTHQQHVRLPRPIASERVAGYLTAIHANGGSIPLAALASRVGEPADQLRMALTMVQRLVNLDGAEILAVRGNATVELNTELLAMQFEVDVP